MAKKGPARKSIEVPLKLLDNLWNHLVDGFVDGSIPENGELHNAVEEILRLVPANGFTGDTFSFPNLFTTKEDYDTVVKWLKKDKYINEEFGWIAPGNQFSWMLKHIYDRGYTKMVPSPKSRRHIAKNDFHKTINMGDIDRYISGPVGTHIRSNPRRKP